jgi:putative ABC transport system permease protein
MLRRLRAFGIRLIDPLFRRARERELDAELRAHLELHTDDNIRAGMSPADARRAALRKLGGLDLVKEQYRDRRGLPLLDTLSLDIRYGWRLLLRTPTVSAIVVASLALGIGANAAMFSIFDALLLRSLPVREPWQLAIVNEREDRDRSWTNPIWESLRDINRQRHLFSAAGAWSSVQWDATDSADATQSVATHPVRGLYASGNLFELFGVPAVLGRTLVDADDQRRGGPDGPVAVLSFRYWQDHFGGAADIVGRRITLNRIPFTVIGVTPANFFGPDIGEAFDIAAPIGVEPLLRGNETRLDARASWWLTIVLRTRPDQSIEEAAKALHEVQPEIRAATMPQDWTADDKKTFLNTPLLLRPAANGSSVLRLRYQQALATLMVVVGLVLLIACVNIANLLLARAHARRHEFSLRLALGASRLRICRQLLVESLMLSAMGAAIGLLFARWSSVALVQMLSTRTREVFLDLSLDARVLAFTTLAATATALLFGLAPAIQAARSEPTGGLKAQVPGQGHSRTVAGESRIGLGSVLVIAQVALSLVLIIGAGLFVGSLQRLTVQSLGFDRDRVLVAHVEVRPDTLPVDQRPLFAERLRLAAAAVPGVELATASSVTPVSGDNWAFRLDAARHPELSPTPSGRSMLANMVGPEFFKTFGTRLIAGREFTAADTRASTAVCIVNETFARRVFGGASPIGRMVYLKQRVGRFNPPRQVVGYVADTFYSNLRQAPPPVMYFPLTQVPILEVSTEISVRPAPGIAPDRLIAPLRVALEHAGYDASLSFIPLGEQVDNSLIRERLLASLSAFFGALGLLLAAIGLYGVTSYAVTRRRTEIGIRIALGALPAQMIRMVLTRVTLLVALGLITGAAFALWLSRLVATLLFGLEPRDPVTFTAAAALLAVIGLFAAWLPARRASRIDPARTLREG